MRRVYAPVTATAIIRAVTTQTSKEIHLARRPRGEPEAVDFALVDVAVADPADGEVVVRNTFISVDPYMRGRMNDVASYLPPFAIGAAMDGGAVGEVVTSRSPDLGVGDTVLHQQGWREFAVGLAHRFRRVDATAAPVSAYLGALGMPGLTAWVGLTEIAELRDGDTVFISGAAGAVGGTAGQIAKLRGAARVIGSAGTDEKVAYLRDELHFDAAFNYHDGPVHRQLRDAAPDGINVYFDNVGGDHLEAALGSLRTNGRVALCGAIAQYNATDPQPGPRNLELVIGKRLRLRGFIILDHLNSVDLFVAEVAPRIADGTIRSRETIVPGIENAPAAFIGLLRGDNIGKMLVEV